MSKSEASGTITVWVQGIPLSNEAELAEMLRQVDGVQSVGSYVGDINASAYLHHVGPLVGAAIGSGLGTLGVTVFKGASDGVKDAVKDYVKRKLSKPEAEKVEVVLYGPDDKPIKPSKKQR